MIDLSRFKVVYREKVLNAVALLHFDFYEAKNDTDEPKLKFIDVLVITSDGTLRILRDEAWCFQFLPIVGKEAKA